MMNKRKVGISEAEVEDTLTSDTDMIKSELKQLRKAVEKQNDAIQNIATMLKKLINTNNFNNKIAKNIERQAMFPIETEHDLVELDKEIKQNPEKYHETLRDIVFQKGGLEKQLKCIISSEVALAYNWDGTNGKKAFKDFKHFNEALFNAVQPEISTTENYKKTIRQALRRIKNLHFKRLSLQKKQVLKEDDEPFF